MMHKHCSAPALAQLGERLREARLNARLTVREAAARAGLRSHGTLVQYENGAVLPPLDRLATLATIYDVPLASFFVSSDVLASLLTLLERASPDQIRALLCALERVAAEPRNAG
ncbi:MAG: helix-turn-helix transcriptional regulator [Roseiflexaceae bacterium]|nr:helix-turn-helix transcriptional regulator [Roseiflexaceae bacterium]MDW8326142.1 helix-turn-helix transcriptional regulator [Anaerolineales bacterium]